MKHQGFIALTSVLIISLIMLALVVGAGAGMLYARFDEVDAFDRGQGIEIAHSCVRILALKLYDPSYGGDETLAVADGQCTIGPETDEGGNERFIVASDYGRAFVVLEVLVRASDGSIASEKEIPSSPR